LEHPSDAGYAEPVRRGLIALTASNSEDRTPHMEGVMPDFYCDQILTGALKVEVLEESPCVLAFNHTRPYWPVHIVVIHKTHIESIDVLSSERERIVLDAIRIIFCVAASVRAEHGGRRVSTNVGEYQSTRYLRWYIHSGRRIRDETGREID
jgi:histidine triad (HIT) family protein